MPNIDVIHPKWSKAVLNYYHEVSVFKSLEDIIGMLSLSTIKLGIATSKTKQELIDEFEPFGLSSYFEHTICASDTGKHKPHPEPLLACLKRLDVPCHEAIYIGDSIYDMQCAKVLVSNLLLLRGDQKQKMLLKTPIIF